MIDSRLTQLDREIFLTGSQAAFRLGELVRLIEDCFLEHIPDDGPYSYRKKWLLDMLATGKTEAERFEIAKNDLMKHLHAQIFRTTAMERVQ